MTRSSGGVARAGRPATASLCLGGALLWGIPAASPAQAAPLCLDVVGADGTRETVCTEEDDGHELPVDVEPPAGEDAGAPGAPPTLAPTPTRAPQPTPTPDDGAHPPTGPQDPGSTVDAGEAPDPGESPGENTNENGGESPGTRPTNGGPREPAPGEASISGSAPGASAEDAAGDGPGGGSSEGAGRDAGPRGPERPEGGDGRADVPTPGIPGGAPTPAALIVPNRLIDAAAALVDGPEPHVAAAPAGPGASGAQGDPADGADPVEPPVESAAVTPEVGRALPTIALASVGLATIAVAVIIFGTPASPEKPGGPRRRARRH